MFNVSAGVATAAWLRAVFERNIKKQGAPLTSAFAPNPGPASHEIVGASAYEPGR